jgi:hypothetical protein
MNGPEWIVDQHGDFLPIGDDGGSGGAVYGPPPGPPKPLKNFLYRCTPGKGITHVRAVIDIRVASAVDGTFLGKKSYSWPVEIEHIDFAFAGGVKKAC